MLKALNIEKIFHDGIRVDLHVLNDINFTLDHAETSAIIGSSGSGKTTLLNILGGLDKPTHGQVLLNDVDVHKLSEKERCIARNEHFGFIYQFHHLLPEFTALENVAMPLLIKGDAVELAKQKAELVLDDVGLSKRLHHKPSELSGGERRKLEIARAMVTNPSLILLDEPFSGVDPIAVEELQTEIRRLVASGVSILITDHNVERTLEVADKAYIMDHGKVIAEGAPKDIIQNELVKKSYLGSTFKGDEFDEPEE